MASRASQRLHLGFRPSTKSAYNSKFRLFLSFCVFLNIQLHHISPLILLSFLEFLTENNTSHSNIANHISAIKACCTIYNLPLSPFQDPRIKYYLKAMALHKAFKVKLKKIVDLHTLQLITRSCDFTYMGQIYKALYLVAFFSFLRISNLLPHFTQSFSPIHQLSQRDLIFAPPGLHIIIKWTKTLQIRDKVKILKLPSLGSSPLCPVSALKNVLSLVPKGKNLPVFQVKTGLIWLPLTDTKARRHFSNVLQKIGLKDSDHTTLTPSFRCHLCIQRQCPLTGDSIPWHLDLGVCVEIHHPGPPGLQSSGCCILEIPTHPYLFLAGVWGLLTSINNTPYSQIHPVVFN